MSGRAVTSVDAYIAAVDYALPARQVTNAELARQHPEWRMNQVALRSGVDTRHWCAPSETALDLGEAACRTLLTRTGFERDRIDAVLFCTQSPDYVMPPNACLLQHKLDLPRSVAALDYSLACSGFIYGLYLANALVRSRAARHVLLVTAETYSKWMHPGDRGPATLFGDGAAATLVSVGAPGIGGFGLGSDGSGAASFMVPAGGARRPRSSETSKAELDRSGNLRSAQDIYMDGAAVLDFVKKEVPALVRALLSREQLTLDEIDLVMFHQGSRLTLDYLHKALRVPAHKQFDNLAAVGNTVSASIPIALRAAERQGRLKPGMRVLLVGFGVGLSWGACVVDWQ